MIFLNEFKSYVVNELAKNIAQELSAWTSSNLENLPFKSLFGEKTRIVIPFSGVDKNASSILKKLKEKGEVSFKTGTVFSAGRNLKFGKYVLNSGEFNTEEKNWWNKSPNPVKQLEDQEGKDDFSIIISRNPIDIARMSDHDGWTSCHATGREYFQCALADAKGAGAIAYVIKTDDLRKIHDLQDQEIFLDDDRNSRGIVPLARLRLRKFVNKHEKYDLAVPEKTVYGQKVPGFKETLLNWSNENQQDKLKGERVRLQDFTLSGGSYQDSTGSSLLNAFFKDSLDKGDVEYDGEDDHAGTIAQMEEELKIIDREYQNKFEFVKVGHFISEDNEPYVQGYGKIEIEIPDNLINHKIIPTNDVLNKLKRSLSSNFNVYSTEVEFEENKISFNIDSDGITVDDYRDFCYDLFNNAEEKKDEIVKFVYQEMYHLGLVLPTKSLTTFHKMQDEEDHDVHFNHFELEQNDDYSFFINISEPIVIKMTEFTKNFTKGVFYPDNYYNYTTWITTFYLTLKKEMEAWHKKFVFMSKRQKTLFPIDDIKSFNVGMNIQPHIQFIGSKISHKKIDSSNPPILKMSFEIHILTQDEDLNDVINYVNFLDKNYDKFIDLINKINEQVTQEFGKSYKKYQ